MKEEIEKIVRDHYKLDKYGALCQDNTTIDIMRKLEKLVGMEYIPGEEAKRREEAKHNYKVNILKTLRQLYNDISTDKIRVFSIETKIPPQECFLSGTGRIGFEPGPEQYITIHTSRKKENV